MVETKNFRKGNPQTDSGTQKAHKARFWAPRTVHVPTHAVPVPSHLKFWVLTPKSHPFPSQIWPADVPKWRTKGGFCVPETVPVPTHDVPVPRHPESGVLTPLSYPLPPHSSQKFQTLSDGSRHQNGRGAHYFHIRTSIHPFSMKFCMLPYFGPTNQFLESEFIFWARKII